MPGLVLPVTTERLALRLFRAADADDVFDYQGLDEVARYLYRPARSHQRCVEVIERISAEPTWGGEDDEITLAITLAGEDRVIGEVVLRTASVAARQAEIGWVLNPRHEGHGYATEAARALARVAFEQLGTHRLHARLDVENTGSVRLCERLGMRREAHLIENDVHPDGRWGSEYVYAVLESEFKS